MKRFEGKVAVITGGNSGIGLATAKAFAREGASVVITGRDDASLKRAEREIGGSVTAIRADVSRLPEIDRAMGAVRERFKKIDALFVNAGIGKFVPFDQVTEEFFDETVAVNLKGAFFTVHKALPLLLPGTAVVLNASINAHKGMPGTTVYGATKRLNPVRAPGTGSWHRGPDPFRSSHCAPRSLASRSAYRFMTATPPDARGLRP